MILAIDLGQKTTGLAISEGNFASPYKTIKHKDQKEALRKIIKIIDEISASKVVVGYVEGKIKKLFEDFASSLKSERPNLEIVLWDETLTSRQATDTMIKLGIARRRRQTKEHSVAAAGILQSYLDEARPKNRFHLKERSDEGPL